jgi:diguanylate cyclase (GGDEF)-like protein
MRRLTATVRDAFSSRFLIWYRGLTFAHKLQLFPQLTALALGSVLFVTVGFGVLAERRLERLGNQYYPVVESGFRLDQGLTTIQRKFQDAVAASDLDELAMADSLWTALAATIERHEEGGLHGEGVAFRSLFEAYFTRGRDVSRRMISGESGDRLFLSQHDLMARHRVLRSALEADARADRAAMADAIALERMRQRAAWIICVVLTLGFVVAVFALSRAAGQSLTIPLAEAVRVADRVAEGDLAVQLPIVSNDDEVGHLLRSMDRMVANLRSSEDRLVHQATHDALTGLANRTLFRERVGHAMNGINKDRTIAVMYIDLDNFKDVNDGLGHDAGDQLLGAIADRLLSATRGSDTVARLGGDEFAILLRGVRSQSEVVIVADRVLRSLDVPLGVASTDVRVGASVGIAFGEPHSTAEDLLRQADVAMYAAKHGGKGGYVIFEQAMHKAALERLVLETDLRAALDRGELELHYQPVVDLASRTIVGAEALIRWRHPERGLVSPVDFIPLAESTGLIIPIGRWVLSEACRQAAAWQRVASNGRRDGKAPAEAFTIGVNISAWQVQHPTMVESVREALRESGLHPSMLMLEITESVMLRDTNATLSRLRELKALGLSLAVDDFGTGYSSLSYLQRFPIDVLKIDKAFVDPLGASGERASLTRAIVALGDALGLQMVAEGIERSEQVEGLRFLGCPIGQGFLFSEPLPAADFSELLDESVGRRAPPLARVMGA